MDYPIIYIQIFTIGWLLGFGVKILIDNILKSKRRVKGLKANWDSSFSNQYKKEVMKLAGKK